MITALLVTALLAAAIVGWLVNDLTSGRRTRRRLRKRAAETPSGPIGPAPQGLLGMPVIRNDLVPRDQVWVISSKSPLWGNVDKPEQSRRAGGRRRRP